MRVAVLGSSRPLGREVARELADHPFVDDVARPDPSSVEKALTECDVAVGCFGWDLVADEAACLTAVRAGVAYLSSSMSSEVPEVFKGCHAEAERAGVPVVVGISWTPGLTGLMAAAGLNEVHSVQEIRVSWLGSGSGLLGDEAMILAMHAFSGPSVVFRQGVFGRESPGGETEDVFFPEPVGWSPVHLCNSAEASSIPLSVPTVRRVITKGALAERGLDVLVRTTARLSAGASGAGSRRAAKLVQPVIPNVGRLRRNKMSWSALRVDVTGEQKTVSYAAVDQLSNFLIAPLVVAAEMVGRGLVKGSGVMGAESAFDHGAFLGLLARRGVKIARLVR